MKSYTITVNGNVYDVTVEEKGGVTPAAAPAPQAAPVMAQAPQAAPGTGCKIHRSRICSGEGRSSRQGI